MWDASDAVHPGESGFPAGLHQVQVPACLLRADQGAKARDKSAAPVLERFASAGTPGSPVVPVRAMACRARQPSAGSG